MSHHVQQPEVGAVASLREGARPGDGRVCQPEQHRRYAEGRNASDDRGKPPLDNAAEQDLLEEPWRW